MLSVNIASYLKHKHITVKYFLPLSSNFNEFNYIIIHGFINLSTLTNYKIIRHNFIVDNFLSCIIDNIFCLNIFNFPPDYYHVWIMFIANMKT